MREHHHPQTVARILLTLLLVSCLCSCSLSHYTPRIALVTSSGTGHYWENIIEGAQVAAQKRGAKLTIYSPPIGQEGQSLDLLVEKALANDADALLFATNGENYFADYLAENAPNIPLVQIGTRLSLENTRMVQVLNNDFYTGRDMVRPMLEELGKNQKVALLCDQPENTLHTDRETALRGELEVNGATVVARRYCGDSQELAYQQTMQLLFRRKDIDVLFAFNAQATVGAMRAVQYLKMDVPIIGTDVVPEIITGLEKGDVMATTVRNSFAMGYCGVEYALGAIQGISLPFKRTFYSVLVTLENLFTPEIEKIVFPFEGK